MDHRRIYTITPNPALDLSGLVNQLIPNEKNYVYSEARYPGGNAVNVARLLTRLGAPTCATGFLGNNIGNEIKTLLNHEKVKHHFVEIKGHTRISVSISNLKTHQQTRLSFPGPRIEVKEIQALTKKIAQIPQSSMLVLGGSFPPGFEISHANHLIRTAQERNIPVVVDVPGTILGKIHLDGLLLIKPNLIEFQELIGKKVRSISSVGRAAQNLARKVRFVCISSVKGGALLASRNSIWFGVPPPIKLLSTVGAGDSMVAGMVAKLWRQQGATETNDDDSLIPELLRYGLSSAAATLSTNGTQLGSRKDILKFYRGVEVQKITI